MGGVIIHKGVKALRRGKKAPYKSVIHIFFVKATLSILFFYY